MSCEHEIYAAGLSVAFGFSLLTLAFSALSFSLGSALYRSKEGDPDILDSPAEEISQDSPAEEISKQ